jgi:hypothetical protein
MRVAIYCPRIHPPSTDQRLERLQRQLDSQGESLPAVQISTAQVRRRAYSQLCSDAKHRVDDLALSYSIALGYRADLRLSPIPETRGMAE